MTLSKELIKDVDRAGCSAYLETVDSTELPDGAWWQVLEDAVTQYNKDFEANLDPNDTVHWYLKNFKGEQK